MGDFDVTDSEPKSDPGVGLKPNHPNAQPLVLL